MIGTPAWAPANSRSHAQTVAEVMEVRCVTLQMARVVACNAASTWKRCRPLGALPQRRSPHHTSPTNGAKTTCAASRQQTTRCAALASAQRGARCSVLQASCAVTAALAGMGPPVRGLIPQDWMTWRTCVGPRLSPVRASMLAPAAATVAGGHGRQAASLRARESANGLCR